MMKKAALESHEVPAAVDAGESVAGEADVRDDEIKEKGA